MDNYLYIYIYKAFIVQYFFKLNFTNKKNHIFFFILKVYKKKDDESAELMNTSFTCMTSLYLIRISNQIG